MNSDIMKLRPYIEVFAEFPYTICLIRSQVLNYAPLAVGVAKCNPVDKWDTAKGLELAVVRAGRQLLEGRDVMLSGDTQKVRGKHLLKGYGDLLDKLLQSIGFPPGGNVHENDGEPAKFDAQAILEALDKLFAEQPVV